MSSTNPRRNLALALILLLAVSLLSACGNAQADPHSASSSDDAPRIYKLGVNGTDFEVWENVSSRLEAEGIRLEIISFSDYIKPNIALAEGEIDLNAFQTEIYFQDFIAAHGLDLSTLGYTVVAPMGIYSEKIAAIEELPDQAVIAIPNDATNGGRAIKFLESLGLLDVEEGAGLTPTIFQVERYLRDIRITEMVATQIPRSLQDVDIAIINNGVAYEAGLSLAEDAIIYEDPDAPHMKNYWNIIAVRSEDVDKPDYQAILSAYQQKETLELLERKYGGQSIPVFEVTE